MVIRTPVRFAVLLHASFMAVSLGLASARAADPSGAGATFPAPVVERWAAAYERSTGIHVGYAGVGSVEGLRRVARGAVDFAVSDLPLTPGELDEAGLLQFPMVVGGVVPVVWLPGVGPHDVRLSADLLARIFLGRISRWNDPALKALNPDVELPDVPMVPIHRSDGSGTTYLFTSYLTAADPEWRDAVGAGTTVTWPSGRAADGNAGVAAAVRDLPGAIGYVEYAFGAETGLSPVRLRNRAGEWVRCDEAAFRAAVARARWDRPNFAELLVDRPDPGSWPVVGASYVLLPRGRADAGRARVERFFDWAFHHGASIAAQAHYVPLDDEGLIARIAAVWKHPRPNAEASAAKPR
jgi:phosphate transport system substrate-binding protein